MAELVTDRETAVLVPVPEAERVVSPHRSRLDGAAALGVPAHVTVLFPFVPPSEITPSVVDVLAAAVAAVSAFGMAAAGRAGPVRSAGPAILHGWCTWCG